MRVCVRVRARRINDADTDDAAAVAAAADDDEGGDATADVERTDNKGLRTTPDRCDGGADAGDAGDANEVGTSKSNESNTTPLSLKKPPK